MSKALALNEEGKEIAIYGQEMVGGQEAAQLLKASMNRKEKKIFFNNREYPEFHDLQVISNYFNHSVRTHDATLVDFNGVLGFKAHADLIDRNGIVIGGAEAFCLRDEPNWAKKPLYQLASMAQTRAAAKCITNNYRWVIDMAGYGTTPAEEMSQDTLERPVPPKLEHSGPKPWPHPGDDLKHATIAILEIKDFQGKKAPYIRVYATDTSQYMVFDKQLIEQARGLVGSDVSISYEESRFGKTIKGMSAL